MHVHPGTSGSSTSTSSSPSCTGSTSSPGGSTAESVPSPEAVAEDRRRLVELEHEIATLSAQIDAATYRLLRAIAEFDRRGGWHAGFCSCAHWLSYRVGIEPVTAREKVRVARALEQLPCISEALARGRISYSKVRELTRIATSDNEQSLVELAQSGTACHVQRVVRAYRRSEQAALGAAERQREGRYLSLHTDEDGMLVVQGRLPSEVGALLNRALEVAGQQLRRRARADDASAEARHDVVDPGTVTQRRADALALVAEAALGGLGLDGRGEPYQVVLHVDEEVLSGERTDGGRCHLEHGAAVSAETARRLCCDAPVVQMTEDARGQTLDVGRKTRRVNAALWRAIKTRDQTCCFPGCGVTTRLTAHHIRHWAAGGHTSLDNAALLCPAHHVAVHEGGFTVRGHAPDGLTFYTPSGVPLAASPAPPPLPADPLAELAAEHAAAGLELGPRTNLIGWDGERMDLDWVVEDLRLSAQRRQAVVVG